MQIDPTAEQTEFIRRAIATGRVRRAEEAVQQALELWVERERTREEILTAIDEAEASLAGGEGTVITRVSMKELTEEIKHRGRARLAAEQKLRR
ncbi:MAG: ribbon-helix-helix domain-containing protein [Stellaceae bacterium]